jgi:hypothetical protein
MIEAEDEGEEVMPHPHMPSTLLEKLGRSRATP